MTLPVPKLDSRTYDDLLAEALRRLPLHTPEYTNHNESDPGRAILEANAFLTETLLYQINRVPEQTYVAFLNLIGIAPRPARAARAELSFTLKDLKKAGDPLVVDIPLGSQVAVDDPDLDQDVVFETDTALRAVNADFGLALVPQSAGSGAWQAVTSFDSAGEKAVSWLHAFHPFTAEESAGKQFLFAVVLRPKADEKRPEDRMPSGPLSLFVEASEVLERDPSGAVIDGPVIDSAGPLAPPPDAPAPVTWEVFAGAESASFTPGGSAGWEPLNLSLDQTEGLTRSGHVMLELPASMVGVRLGDASAGAWDAMDRKRAPRQLSDLTDYLDSGDAFAEDLKAAIDEDTLAAIGVADPAGMLAACADAAALADALAGSDDTIAPSALSQEEWAVLHPDFAAPDVPTIIGDDDVPSYLPLYFFRVTLNTPRAKPRLLNRLRLNTVSATAASTRKDERLGVSNGRPGQVMRLARTPVYFDPLTGAPDIELTVTHGGEVQTWTQVADFHGHGPADRVFLLDPASGEVQFGDGRPSGIGGAIPPTGAVIRAARYRFGGGTLANVAQGTITKIKGALTGVKEVTNPRAAAGGADGETLEQVMRRAPSTLRRRERAVSAADFADLARETPGAVIHKAYAVAAREPHGSEFRDKAGAVSVVVLPDIDHPTPQPDEDILSAVREWLNPRRLITTELHVLGPRYFHITALTAKLKVDPNTDFATVTEAAKTALTEWLHPIRGGEDGAGWPFGTDIFHADIYDRLLAVPGVRRVQGLHVAHDPVSEVIAPDVIPLPEGYLPALAPGAIGFEVGYV
ncbi:MAG: putative baseplate assembly protein [Alphaproteobacteria bacterium]|jgi:hypothetical protein|nr:putative baseplate assembly protein [Alphaproteobacteria bacterium]